MVALHALQSVWTLAQLEAQLAERDSVVAIVDGVIAGGAGWVATGRGFFGAPVIAPTLDVATTLLDHLVELARDADWIRIGCADLETVKREALLARGFRAAFDFITLGCAAARRDTVIGLAHVAIHDVDPAAGLRELHRRAIYELTFSASR